MHERTRRRLLIIAFFALCVLPTLAVTSWAVWHQFSWHSALLAKKLSRELGVDVQLQGVRYPRPRQILLSGVTVSDPETKQPIARAESIELTRTMKGSILVASQPSFELEHAREFWQWLDHLVLRRDWRFDGQMALHAAELTLNGADTAHKLKQVACHWKHDPTGPQARVTFNLDGQRAKPSTQLRVVRNRQITPPATGIEIQCLEPLPCKLFGDAIASRVGHAASFQGKVTGTQTPTGWRIAIDNAWLSDVQLEDLMQMYPHRLTGKATIALQQAEFSGGRLVEATGTLSAGPGNVGKSLLESARDAMKLDTGSHLKSLPGSTLHYQQLAFHFDIREDAAEGGLRIQGACQGSSPGALPSGTIMADNEGDLIRQPVIQRLPVVSLVAALAPGSEIRLPAAPETSLLLSVLPMSPMVPTAEPEQRRMVRQANGDEVRR